MSSLPQTLTPLLAVTALKSTALLLLAALLVVIQRKSSAAVRHLTWSVALLGAVLLPGLSALLPALHVPEIPNLWPAISSPATTLPVTSFAASPSAAEAPASVVDQSPSNNSFAPPIILVQPTPLPAPVAKSFFTADLLWRSLGAIWLTGFSLALAYLLLGWAQAWWLTRRCTPLIDPQWQSLLEEISASLGLRRRVRLLASDKVKLPMTWGAWRPVLLLPASAITWPELRRRIVLAHELAHVQRWDWLTLTLANFACAIYWYNPLAWLAAKKMCLEREQACDDLVLHRDTRPSDYAGELLQIAASFQGRSFLDSATVPMARRSALEGRLLAILDGHRNRAGLTRRATVAALALFTIVALPIAMLRAATADTPASSTTSPNLPDPFASPGTTTAASTATSSTSPDPFAASANPGTNPVGNISTPSMPPVVTPRCIAVDQDGWVYVVDYVRMVVYKVSPTGQLSVLADCSQFPGMEWRSSIAIDHLKNIYTADASGSVIYKITPNGQVSALAGHHGLPGFADGQGDEARFDFTVSLTCDGANNLYAADNHSFIIRKITPNGHVTTLAGRPGQSGSADGAGSSALFAGPRGIGAASDGTVYVADEHNHNIRKIAPDGTVSTIAGSPTHKPGSADGAGPEASFSAPRAIVVDAHGNIYVADTDNNTIRKITPPNLVTTFAGKAGEAGYVDGAAATARFDSPRGLAVDKDDNLYVADSNNSAIRKISPAGFVTSLYAPPSTLAPATPPPPTSSVSKNPINAANLSVKVLPGSPSQTFGYAEFKYSQDSSGNLVLSGTSNTAGVPAGNTQNMGDTLVPADGSSSTSSTTSDSTAGATNWNGNFTYTGTNTSPNLAPTHVVNDNPNTLAYSSHVSAASPTTSPGALSNNPIAAANLGINVIPDPANQSNYPVHFYPRGTLTLQGRNTFTPKDNNPPNVMTLYSKSGSGNLVISSTSNTSGTSAGNSANPGEQNPTTSTRSNGALSNALVVANPQRDADGHLILSGPSSTTVQRVTVLGQVNQPGPVEYSVGTNLGLREAVAQAGGPTAQAAATVEVTRYMPDGTRKVFPDVALLGAMKGTDPDFPLQDGDIVRVEESLTGNLYNTPPATPTMLVTVLGYVNKPGTLIIPVGSTLTLVAAIKQAGGSKPQAARYATVSRILQGARTNYQIDLAGAMNGTVPDFPLLPNDTITLGEQILTGVYKP